MFFFSFHNNCSLICAIYLRALISRESSVLIKSELISSVIRVHELFVALSWIFSCIECRSLSVNSAPNTQIKDYLRLRDRDCAKRESESERDKDSVTLSYNWYRVNHCETRWLRASYSTNFFLVRTLRTALGQLLWTGIGNTPVLTSCWGINQIKIYKNTTQFWVFHIQSQSWFC